MSNPWIKFKALLAPGAKQIVTVASVGADGTSIVTVRDGSQIRVAGDSVAAGEKAIIQDGKIMSKAPSLPMLSVEV
ncbi:hypothetical protein [Parathalassolituus penaei]|uniref:Uncharacterized protein n=1 Tax=Parathalassolituus penaei TaxID=2997323 RepID=A0A9X3EEI0_9GAMM|nr:hypothetical protein [Parathalassolituus penaei]MCY0966122.1 hypothetical protein [Parathalassolituus penaei]